MQNGQGTASANLRAAIYARVSTADQNNAIQVRELKEYVERRGWELTGIYEDQMSGAKVSRPGLDQLMTDARRRKFDVVVVWKLDRFGRSLVHCVSGIQELASLGIRFIATSQGLDTDEANPASKLLMHILAAVAQFERELIRERVSAGMKAAKTHGTKTGNAIGRPRRIFNRDEVVRLRETGLSIEKIASQMRIGVGTVVRVLQADNVQNLSPSESQVAADWTDKRASGQMTNI
jgi:DNA invertase Pin-like site-specific DNA recombinase